MKNLINKTQQKICAIWRKTKQHISSFVGGQFKKRKKRNEIGMSREIREHIDMFRDFFNKSKILEEISDQLNENYDYSSYKNKLLLLYEIGVQRTYIFRVTNFFLIINDNRGNIVIATKQPIARFNFKIYDTNNNFYEIKFDGIVEKIKVSKRFFYSIEELKQKLNEL
jgi:hypothetical protein